MYHAHINTIAFPLYMRWAVIMKLVTAFLGLVNLSIMNVNYVQPVVDILPQQPVPRSDNGRWP